MAVSAVAGFCDHFADMSRPQIGIDRLPVRRPSMNEPKEAMNCKSCRKRKASPKCPSGHGLGLCSLTHSQDQMQQAKAELRGLSDAIPKKRGPKTDVLEALLKRVNGLEKRLKDEKNPESADTDNTTTEGASATQDESHVDSSSTVEEDVVQPLGGTEASRAETKQPEPQPIKQTTPAKPQPQLQAQPQAQPHQHEQFQAVQSQAFAEALVDIYFARLHGKPYYILDEPATRQRLRDGQLPRFLNNAIYAVSIRHATHMCGGLGAAIGYSQEHARQARQEIDVDEPSIEHLQALLLLTMASFQSGRGKRSYMLLSHAISMAFALSLHRELPSQLRISPSEREGRRKLFWTCYLMDRFTVSGSKRPTLISDEAICLRLPAWLPAGAHLPVDGNFFPNGSSLPYAAGMSTAGQGIGAMLVEIVRVLGVTNRYLAAGGVKGDSHFPWHAQSTLSRIRSDLDYWAANTHDAFASLDALFGQADSSTLVLSKLIYHLIHCLIYRPFLPIDLAELSGSGQHQSWQIEATNLCFLHANAIAELVEIGKTTSITDWPSFVGYCICTAGTIHVHGAHYVSLRDGDVFGNSADFLNREMAQLYELRYAWAGVQHQRETLQAVYASHSQLVKSLTANPTRFSPVFQMEDFFDRYPGSYIDGAHVTFPDVDLEMMMQDTLQPYHNGLSNGSFDGWMNQPMPEMNSGHQPMAPSQYMTQNQMPPPDRRRKRRRTNNMTSSLQQYPTPMTEATPNGGMERRMSHNSYAPAPPQQTTQLQPQPSFAPDGPEQPPNPELLQNQTLSQSALSPSFNFNSPLPQGMNIPPVPTENDNIFGSQFDAMWSATWPENSTPGGISTGSGNTDEKDPFLTFLEQLAQNESGQGDLDFFLNGQGGEQGFGGT
ncbi:hypothetical protein D0860_06039 [Hortaea werneckii]|uniref:Xylanolytic transcriptional activator regulatory domain-containing protein n=2 Tax=Hortaea werneckii TaxID=91943 RepID=A0A3M7GW59_HORWE|nr:hypothetical protein D0860_06039 [Hortaea werneckii]